MERQLFRVSPEKQIPTQERDILLCSLSRKHQAFCTTKLFAQAFFIKKLVKQMHCLSDRFQRREPLLFSGVSFDDALSDFSYEILHFCSLP